MARHAGGQVVLRIEDIDSPRVKSGAAAEAIDDLRWLGLVWDVGPILQSERLPHYEDAFSRLQAAELVYPCTCTRSDIEAAASAPHADGAEVPYPGTCAHRRAADAVHLAGRAYAWRFRVTHSPAFMDRFRGPTAVDLRMDGGDFVVWKSSGTPAYQLAVVVDDAAAGITDVVRGDDLIASTPRQLLLYEHLGLVPPRFCHLPLVVGPDGRRLAKRHGDTRLRALRDAGVPPEAVLGLLAGSCGWLNELAAVSAQNLVRGFRLDSIPPRPFVLTDQHLRLLGYTPRR